MVAIEVLKSLQELYLADDIEIPLPEATSWTAEQAEKFFESGGLSRPPPPAAASTLASSSPAVAAGAVDVADAVGSSAEDEEFMRKRRILAKAAGLCVSPSSAPAAEASSPPPKPMPRFGTFRWMVDISVWEPTHDEWQLLLDQLPSEDSTRIMKFHFVADRKRALVSRFLQRRACYEATGVPWSSVKIERTKGGKPFMANKPKGKTLVALATSTSSNGGSNVNGSSSASSPPSSAASLHANWNFNVSHEGKYVVLAADPVTLCGVDVAAPEDERRGANKRKGSWVEENLSIMEGQLTAGELAVINGARPDERKMEDAFRKFWALKEAYTKARGDGLGFEFNRCDFELGDGSEKGLAEQPVQRASVTVDRMPLPKWGFYIQPLEADHWTSVARGPPVDIIDAIGKFKAGFGEARLAHDLLMKELEQPEPPFAPKTIADLIADEIRPAFAKAAARK